RLGYITVACTVVVGTTYLLPVSSIASAATPAYTITDLGTLPPVVSGTPISSLASAISSTGEVVGWSTEDNQPSHAFRWTAETGMRTIINGLSSTAAQDINIQGQVAGAYNNSDNTYGAVVWDSTNVPQYIPDVSGSPSFKAITSLGIN